MKLTNLAKIGALIQVKIQQLEVLLDPALLLEGQMARSMFVQPLLAHFSENIALATTALALIAS